MPDFSSLIRRWYNENKRSLPWRATNDPYHIWLSEIILQQTRVEQGRPYYLEFINSFPTVEALANAQEIDVLKTWEGLGYYSRARNLHSTAKYIAFECEGKFPSSYEELMHLLSRVFDLDIDITSNKGQKQFRELANQLICKKNPAEHNQAIMELGALICNPMAPKCSECPVKINCLAYANQTINLRPVKSKKTKSRSRHFIHLVFWDGKKTIISKRNDKDIWQHLYEFPGIEVEENEGHPAYYSQYGEPVDSVSLQPHILSHQRIHATYYLFTTLPLPIHENWEYVSIAELHNFPFSRLTLKFLQTKKLKSHTAQ